MRVSQVHSVATASMKGAFVRGSRRDLKTPLIAALIGLTSVSCASFRRAQVQAPTLAMVGSGEVSQDGLRVELAPITYETVRMYPQIFRSFQVGERVVERALVPLPAFRVRVSNNTGHVLRFTGAIFRAQDQARRVSPIADRDELQAWFSMSLSADPQLRNSMAQASTSSRAALMSLPLFTRNLELLNGDEWSGFLVFNWGTSTREEELLQIASTERLLVRLAEVPTAMNEAGVVSRTAEFQYRFRGTTYPQDVICDPHVGADQPPSLSTCLWDPPTTQRVSSGVAATTTGSVTYNSGGNATSVATEGRTVSAAPAAVPTAPLPPISPSAANVTPTVARGENCHALRFPEGMTDVTDEAVASALPASRGGNPRDGTYRLVRYVWYGEGTVPSVTRRTALSLQGTRLQMVYSRAGGGAVHVTARALFTPGGTASLRTSCPEQGFLEFDRFSATPDELTLISTRDHKVAVFQRAP